MSIELLQKLSPKTVSWMNIPGCITQLTPSDIANILALLDHKPAAVIGRIKYAGQIVFVKDLERYLLLEVVDISVERKWGKMPQGFLRELCRLALMDFLSAHICKSCDGQGHHSGQICHECKGLQHNRNKRDMEDRLYSILKRFKMKNIWRLRLLENICPILDGWDLMLREHFDDHL